MKIAGIEVHNHPILGNLKLSFKIAEDIIADTIIIAGENGTGKSTLLDLLSIKREQDLHVIFPTNGWIRYDFIFSEEETKILMNDYINSKPLDFKSKTSILIEKVGDRDIRTVLSNNSQEYSDYPIPNLLGRLIDERFLSILHVDTNVDFSPANISSITNQDVKEDRESGKNKSLKTDRDLSTTISQLLVDLNSADAYELSDWLDKNLDKGSEAPRHQHKRIKIFKEALSVMFEKKLFLEKVDHITKNILFTKNGISIPLNSLSTGEKQIVLKGAFVLQHQYAIENGIILVDEPELSMHPDWQLKILDYYKALASNKNGKQTAQLFVVTHSPFILHSGTKIGDKIIVLQEQDGKVFETRDPEFPNYTTPEIINAAFGLECLSIFQNADKDDIIILTEGKTDAKYIEKTIKVFNLQDKNFKVYQVGENASNGTKGGGQENLKKHKFVNQRLINAKSLVLWFDCDVTTEKNEKIGQKIWVRLVEQFENNKYFEDGIENMLILDDELSYEKYKVFKDRRDKNNPKTLTDNEYEAKITELSSAEKANALQNFSNHVKKEVEKVKLCDNILGLENTKLEVILKNIETTLSDIYIQVYNK